MKLVLHLHRDVELLAHLPFQTPTVILARFGLSAGKLPVSGQMRSNEPFRDEDQVSSFDDRGDHHRPVRRPCPGH